LVRNPDHGGLVLFLGTVRAAARGRKVLCLQYEAYRPMAEKRLWEIEEEMKRRWGPLEVSILHRLGRVKVGEVGVAIAVSALNRRQAFAACRFAIDQLKKTVPLWKKEIFPDGWEWARG
jgi:molybdopterin synthase catalytic subunit